MNKKITFCAMMAVLGVVSVALTMVIPTNKLFFYCFSTLFTYVCVEEYGAKYGLLTYAVISVCGFLLVSNKPAIIAYALIIGYYPVLKHYIEHLNQKSVTKWILKLSFALIAALVAYFLLRQLMVFNFPVPLLFAGGLFVFAIYDFALTEGLRFYALRLRKHK